MSWENIRINIKDVITYSITLVTIVLAIGALSSKLDNLSTKFDEMKQDNKEVKNEDKVTIQNMINQVNANTIQIKLLEQKVSNLENRK